MEEKKEKKTIKKKMAKSCDTCEFYVFDEEYQEYVCDISLDQDEYEQISKGLMRDCPYYRFYDEYKSVQKQN